ncbi:MAG: Phosphatidylinositol-4-phosphate 5-kinase [Piccolia ochrophora]|nr:MAG: Phosphatidylinositol-4-phosphate 5-kinase [Piccolia ochrophora]
MPSLFTDGSGPRIADGPSAQLHRTSHEKSPVHSNLAEDVARGSQPDGIPGRKSTQRGPSSDVQREGSLHSLPNGRPSGGDSTYSREKTWSREGSAASGGQMSMENGRRSPAPASGLSKSAPVGSSYFPTTVNGSPVSPTGPSLTGDVPERSPSRPTAPQAGDNAPSTVPSDPSSSQPAPNGTSHRFSSPPNAHGRTHSGHLSASFPPSHPPLQHRHTLQVPKVTTLRTSRDFSAPVSGSAEDVLNATGRFSPTTSGIRRASINLARRATRSVHSDIHLDEVPQTEDAAKIAETIHKRRASKRRRKQEEDEDRVVVGTRVDQHHVNFITAYNMLTGIRFTVSRTNAKIDRELTPADFTAKHKFSFDITGSELTPSAKYDFKFKDYAPWVFRHLRAKFERDPGDYLMSLTSRYIVSELGSPGKSGSFFYYSRDYKYIIKTIHHAEHKILRKILKDYYDHVQSNPNTLLSQFYGLHRVKIPYGKKLHFVVMNNLFPAHRDLQEVFDLKGSTIGRDLKDNELLKNPRAPLKDLNWLRREQHLHLGPHKKETFISQVERDVKLLQKLKIMDYSMLVGIHNVTTGTDQKLREKNLRVFQPGGERSDDESIVGSMLTRTPSKLETAKKARELRQIIKKEKPVPMEMTASRMPDEMPEDERKNFTFYGDDGGFKATHEDDTPGEAIYYLGIIDCLTYYGIVKKAEHFWKGLSNPKSQISPIRPEPYGERFISFITGITKPREESDREQRTSSARGESSSVRGETSSSLDLQFRLSGHLSRTSTDRVMEKAERQARKTEREGASEAHAPDRNLTTLRSPSADRTNGTAGSTLPVVEEAGEHGSTSGRSRDGSVPNEKESTPSPPSQHHDSLAPPSASPPDGVPTVGELGLDTAPSLSAMVNGVVGPLPTIKTPLESPRGERWSGTPTQ